MMGPQQGHPFGEPSILSPKDKQHTDFSGSHGGPVFEEEQGRRLLKLSS